MTQQIKSKLIFLATWLILIKANAYSQPNLGGIKKWVYPEMEGRVIAWEYNNKIHLIEQPITLAIPSRQSKAVPQIGLVHSGYTKEDPDGKNAILSISYKLETKPLNQQEKDSLIRLGFIFDKLSLPATAMKWFLDIELPLDKQEELNIRRKLGMPKAFVPGSIIPLQIKWNDIDGQKLYEWFTSERGLRFKTYSNLEIYNKTEWITHIDAEKFEEWWQNNVTADTLLWQGGPEVLLHRLITNDIISFGITDSKDNMLHNWANQMFALSTKYNDGVLSITKQKLLSVNWKVPSGYYIFKASLPANYSSPGIILRKNENLVKDLSGGVKGLDALLKDSN